jgi:uncharacterized protein (UPF0261 family)
VKKNKIFEDAAEAFQPIVDKGGKIKVISSGKLITANLEYGEQRIRVLVLPEALVDIVKGTAKALLDAESRTVAKQQRENVVDMSDRIRVREMAKLRNHKKKN